MSGSCQHHNFAFQNLLKHYNCRHYHHQSDYQSGKFWQVRNLRLPFHWMIYTYFETQISGRTMQENCNIFRQQYKSRHCNRIIISAEMNIICTAHVLNNQLVKSSQMTYHDHNQLWSQSPHCRWWGWMGTSYIHLERPSYGMNQLNNSCIRQQHQAWLVYRQDMELQVQTNEDK